MRSFSPPPQRGLKVPDTANALLQNRINISIVFNYLREHGIAYRAQIARDLGLSAPAVSRAIERLLTDGYVVESEKVKVENGKKAAQVSVHAERGCIVGVDMMADPMKIAICDFGGTLRGSYLAAPLPAGADFADHLVASIEAAFASFRSESGRRRTKLLAIGLGVPAVVDPSTGSILSASLYESIAASDFTERARAKFKIPVFVENTANLSAIGEWKRGMGRSLRSLAFIEVGNGIGAGIILEGDLYRGARGAAGEIGFFITDPAGLGDSRPKTGYLERRASLGVIQALSRTAAKDDPGAARQAIAEATRPLAIAVINTMLLLNPELVVIGGELCDLPGAAELVIEPLMREIERSCPLAPSKICLSSLGANASLMGAVQFALDSLIVHAYPYRL